MGSASGVALMDIPFPYFGGKRLVADVVWRYLGDVSNYVEPFFGSGAVLFNRPHEPNIETVNDKDHWITNFWRAIQHDPEQVAIHADNPVNEDDLTARHIHLVKYIMPEMEKRMMADPEYYDAKAAGWWVWGMSCWIGSGWCSGKGPWTEDDGQIVYLSRGGQGVNRKRVHLSSVGQGVNRKRVNLIDWFGELSTRLRNVRVCVGDWARVVTDGAMEPGTTVGIFLDPPYTAEAGRYTGLYKHDSLDIGHEVYRWAMEHADNPRYRIALCGYDGEYDIPNTWTTHAWKAGSSYQGANSSADGNDINRHKERIYFSPNCLSDHIQRDLFKEYA